MFGMSKEDFRLTIVLMVFFALLLVLLVNSSPQTLEPTGAVGVPPSSED
jgi:hypothetical protein